MKKQILRVLALLFSGMAFPIEAISLVSPLFFFTDQFPDIRTIYRGSDRIF